MPDLAPSSLATTILACPLCSSTYSKRKELLHPLRTSSHEIHKTFRYDASAHANASNNLALGVLPCPLAHGAVFDGGSTRTSKELDAHIARGTYCTRRLGSLPRPRELDGPFLSPTTRGVTAALDCVASRARDDPTASPLNLAAISFCLNIPDLTATHMKTSGA